VCVRLRIAGLGVRFMFSLFFFFGLTVVLFIVLIYSLWRPKRSKPPHVLTVRDFLPVRHQHFEEVDRRLAEYEEMLKKIQFERRELALAYLTEIQTDFDQVTRLLNRAAKFLPEITLAGESNRLAVALKFKAQCWFARLQIRFGIIPTGLLTALTAKVRFFARLADEFLNVIAQEQGLPILESDLNT